MSFLLPAKLDCLPLRFGFLLPTHKSQREASRCTSPPQQALRARAGMPPSMKFSPTPAQVSQLTHSVHVGKSGGALQGSWDVPSAHSIDRTSSQYSVTDQFEAATAIQKAARGQVMRQHDPHSVHFVPGESTIYDLSAQLRATGSSRVQPGKPSESFEARDAYAVSPYGEGYTFVNIRLGIALGILMHKDLH